jgi:uncharacterized protein (TIGR02246 family)
MSLFKPRGRDVSSADTHTLESLPHGDQEAILTTLLTLQASFRDRDAAQMDGLFTADADWVNAFGSVKKGNDEIVAYLHGLFRDENFNSGQLKAPPELSFRVVGPDVIIISTHLQVEGQRLVGGGEIELRDNFGLHVLERQSDGKWLIISEMFNDANRDHTYEGHS